MADPGKFWAWFQENQQRFRDLEVPEKEALLDELMDHLHDVCDELWFEVGGRPEGPHELIISAEGKTEVFDEVRCLVGAAPGIPGWEITAFKPAQGFDFVTEYEGITFAPSATWFFPLASASDPKALGIRVAYAHFDAARLQTFLSAAYIMLEAGLGELAAAEDIEFVEVKALPSMPEDAGYLLLTELPEYLDSRVRNRGS